MPKAFLIIVCLLLTFPAFVRAQVSTVEATYNKRVDNYWMVIGEVYIRAVLVGNPPTGRYTLLLTSDSDPFSVANYIEFFWNNSTQSISSGSFTRYGRPISSGPFSKRWVFDSYRYSYGGVTETRAIPPVGYNVNWLPNVYPLSQVSSVPVASKTFTFIFDPNRTLDKVDEVNFAAAIKNTSDETVEARLIVDGQVVQEGNIGGGVTTEMEYTDWKDKGHEGSYKWEVKDPRTGAWKSVGGGNYSTSRPASGDMPAWGGEQPGQVVASFGPPPSPDPIPTPEPIPSPTATPRPPSTPNPTPAPTAMPTPGLPITGPGSGPDGELTRQDIYEAVKGALENVGEGETGGDLGYDGMDVSDIYDDRGDIDSVKAKVSDAWEKAEEGVVKMVSIPDNLMTQIARLQSSFGSINKVTLGTLPYVGVVEIDFDGWPVAEVRGVCYLALNIMFFVLFMRTLNYSS